MSIGFNYAALSDIGKIRQSNQDSGYAGPNLLILADGMGGPAGGDIASSIAIDHLRELDTLAESPEEALESLRSTLGQAHQELCERSTQDPALTGFGTTCIAIRRSENALTMTHIGDSRAYRLRGGELRQMTNDHSFVQYLVDTGQLTPDQAENHPQRSVLLRVLGDSQEDVNLDESHPELKAGDRWLLCSDGLCGFVSGQTIGKVLYHSETPQQACESLVELALKAGGPDNVTCVVADIVENPQQSEPQIVGAAATDRLSQVRNQLDALSQETLRLESENSDPDITTASDQAEDNSFSPARAAVPAETKNEETRVPRFRWGRITGVLVGLLVLIGLFWGALWYGMYSRPTLTPTPNLTSVSENESKDTSPDRDATATENPSQTESSKSAQSDKS
ncbi:PP2C family protein-serine/threonine phosphatase [Varibaculum vaginae]|uniref:PP2C family protein-serine/threonine phosphatase n=1 Tax=Varibaculum vaginae TaxID=2364797 RepID=UPI000F092D38|nr:PP2C family serine/threonine-protein phosphatase [Varibaculum vaginae]